MQTITHTKRVAVGVFAPGHLGELTQQIPFEMVDEALAATGAAQVRVRRLPARVVVYLLLAGCLFAELGYQQVWAKLTAGLAGTPTAHPSSNALSKARRRLGVTPLRWLWDLLAGPAATTGCGVRWRGLRVCAIDGTILGTPDTEVNLTVYRKQPGNHGGTGYPQLRLLALVACGTRSIIAACFGPASGSGSGETSYAHQLVAALRPGMLVLADRNFDAAKLLTAIAATDAAFLVRAKGQRRLPVLSRYRDGSYLSTIGATRIRVVEAEITISTSAGRATGVYRLATTLTDHRQYPAGELVRLYHQRWEIETAYLELKSSILGGRVLRARTPTGIAQEVYALLVTYQILRTAMADATNSQPDTDPDRASFTTALQAARDQLVNAAGVIAETVIDLVGTIGRHVLDNLLPARRLRVAPRVVKRAISKYQARGPHLDRTTYQATLTIDILTGPHLTTGPGP
ncbi:MAG TPA: IS4 family transposase [Candidatus Limnocylindrales bacterium]